MGDILPGTTFTPGQLITPDILNRLVGDAEIVDKSIKASMLASDFISALGEITDSEGEDYILIWDASEDALKKIKKTDLAGTAPNVSTADGTLNLGGSSGNTALDFTGSTANNIIKSDNFSIQQSGAMFLPSDVVNLYGTDLAFDYNSTSKTLKYFPLGNTSDPEYAFFGKQLSSIGHKEGQIGLIALSGRDDDVNGVAQYNNWYIYSMADRPQLNIFPDNNMTERPTASANLSEPRVNIRGHVYISDFDDPLKALPIVTDNTKPKLFVDDIYNTDGTALVKDGALVGGSGSGSGVTTTQYNALLARVTALETASSGSGSGSDFEPRSQTLSLLPGIQPGNLQTKQTELDIYEITPDFGDFSKRMFKVIIRLNNMSTGHNYSLGFRSVGSGQITSIGAISSTFNTEGTSRVGSLELTGILYPRVNKPFRITYTASFANSVTIESAHIFFY